MGVHHAAAARRPHAAVAGAATPSGVFCLILLIALIPPVPIS